MFKIFHAKWEAQREPDSLDRFRVGNNIKTEYIRHMVV